MRSCIDVHNFLDEAGVAHEIIQLPALSDTARKAASLLNVPVREVVKSLIYITENGPAVALVPGDSQANGRAVRTALGCRKAALAAPDKVLEITGYRPGAVPPCALAGEMPIVADPSVFESEIVYCGGGTTSTMLKIRSSALREVLGATVAAIVVRPSDSGRSAAR
jgi:Cys-tRNA(Pro)/Cys-tRNA(Cys) deacylase